MTDLPLTSEGERAARALSRTLAAYEPVIAWVSPRERARRTAVLAGIDPAITTIEPDLVEWDYGDVEGVSTVQFRVDHPELPGWTVWDGPVPGGEDAASVGRRCDAVIDRISRTVDLQRQDAVFVAHAHVLRVLTARWLGLPPDQGRLFRLDTSTLSVLGHERDQPVLLAWNASV